MTTARYGGRLSALRTGLLYPQEYSWYSFSLRAESTPGPWFGRKEICHWKNPVTTPGIDPGTVRLVAQRLNHYATPGPGHNVYEQIILRCYLWKLKLEWQWSNAWTLCWPRHMKSPFMVGRKGLMWCCHEYSPTNMTYYECSVRTEVLSRAEPDGICQISKGL